MSYKIRKTEANDIAWVDSLTQTHWGSDFVLSQRQKVYPRELPGLVALDEDETRIGLLTYRVVNGTMEIVTLNASRQHQGIGTQLVVGAVAEAQTLNLGVVWVVTTNDNLDALRFWQRRGFRLVSLRPGAIGEARRLKPTIPIHGCYNIPIHDEIKLELTI